MRASLRLPLLVALLGVASARAAPPDPPVMRRWVEELEQSPRGPFERIRWFCEDGAVLPPRPFACAEHGGGVQHGEWNERARTLRENGYLVANVLAELEPGDFVGPDPRLFDLQQILLERFLIGWDDGWIFRGARSYRGALQIEDEEAGARRVVLAMLTDRRWRHPARFYLLREAVRLMPVQTDEGSAADVRRQALVLAEKDPGFTPLRAKIHNVPDAEDADRVRDFAATQGRRSLRPDYDRLADAIDALYASTAASDGARELAERVSHEPLARALRDFGDWLAEEEDPSLRVKGAARLAGLVRKHFDRVRDPEISLALLQLSLVLEQEVFANGNKALLGLGDASRRERLALLDRTAEGLYGAGLLSVRHLAGIKQSIARLERAGRPTVSAYRDELRYLGRAAEWCDRWIAFDFERAVAHLAPLEPEVHLYSQDRLRGSPMLVYGAVIDDLVRDANALAGIEHELFGRRAGAGLRGLNPGLARGVLRGADGARAGFQSDGIYLLPETTADLPRVAGILTRGEGSSLSHVQLLARNLGIPNVVVGPSLLPEVEKRLGTRVVLAVSPGGVVRLAADGASWRAAFGDEEKTADAVIRPDLVKLDLQQTALLPLDELRAADSGRVSGPKGANLGELKHFFGKAVPDGFVIPFGVFRRLLDQPLEPGGPPVWEWMQERYAAIAAAHGTPRESRLVSQFLARLSDWIRSADPGPVFREQLREQLEESFGRDGSYGVFVRSDTNVEDLSGFTGAGLNLTVPNVVGYDDILRQIHEVWASPFTERAYGWRQAHMESPEYVFPAVVVQLAFPAEKSGVMVTADVESGEADWISIAVSEGVGGAVEGQATESLRVNLRTREVRFLAQATAPERSVLDPAGGIRHEPASGTDAVLSDREIRQLVEFARGVHERFPSLRDEAGRPLAADVEFAFNDGKLALLQIRPFVESRRARSSAYLGRLDAGLRARGDAPVDLDGLPEGGAPRAPVPL